MVLVPDHAGKVFYIVLNTPYNMIDVEFLHQYNQALDQIELKLSTEANSKGKRRGGVIVTIGVGDKVFSSGFNLKFWRKNPANVSDSLREYHNLMRRLLTIGVPTLCVANGHTIAGGVFLCLAHDRVIMNGN